jgi:MraZ protein
MKKLIGEFDCKIDEKGRLKLPAPLLKQLGDGTSFTFVINRGFENNLMMYPESVWDTISGQVDKLNQYVKKNREFVRYFYRGATKVETDSSERILINKKLLEYAAIDKEVVLFAYNDRIEIWSQANYDSVMNEEPLDFSDLAEEVLGNDLKQGL